jgi:uncharacterized protein YjbI with pentapeptide repeats
MERFNPYSATSEVNQPNLKRIRLKSNPQSEGELIHIKPNSVHVKDEINSDILDAVFGNKNPVGFDRIYDLCQQRLLGGDNWLFSQMREGEYEHMKWLFPLTTQTLLGICALIEARADQNHAIFAAFKVGADRYQEILIYSSSPDSAHPHQIIAQAGSIYIRRMDDIEEIVQLLSFVQFLNKHGSTPLCLCNLNLSGMNLSGLNLSGADLCGVNLSGANLSGANLSRVNLSESDLSRANLSGANLSDAILSGSILSESNLSKVNLSRANLSGANLRNSDLDRANLFGATISGVFSKVTIGGIISLSTDLRGASFSEAILDGTNLSQLDLSGLNMSGASLRGANLSNSNLHETNLCGATLSGTVNIVTFTGTMASYTDLRGANLSGAILDGTNLSQLNLSGLNMSGASMRGTDLRSSNLQRTNLWRAKLAGTFNKISVGMGIVLTDLRGANLSEANFDQADLNGLNLSGLNMNGTSFSGASLCETNLCNSTLREANFHNANLHEANISGTATDLSGANFSDAILDGTNMSQLNLSGLNMSGARLSGTNLRNANLRRTNLMGARLSDTFHKTLGGSEIVITNLRGADLVEAQLDHANLDFLDLSGLNMSGTSFTGARLCGVNLCNSTLRNANLIGAILKSPFDVIVFGKKVSTNLRGINLENASLTGVDLNQLDITGASLAGANLTGANLSRANLTKCNLKNTILENADLRGTDLTEAVLNLTRFNNYTKFDEFTVLQRAEITFGFIGGAWHDAPLGQLLDHKINRNNSSLLTVIDSMNVKYVNNEGIPLKINLMHQIIDSFGNVNPLPVHAALLDIFLNNPIYFRDKKIIAFVKKNILNPKISKANTARLNIDNVAELRWYLNMLLKTKVSNQNQNFMLKNNGFFIQLMAFCTGHENVQIKGDAEKVYNKYLNLSPLSIYKTNNLLLPEVTCDAKGYVKDIEDTDRAFIFVSKNGVETNKGLLVSRNDIKEMLNVGTTHDWSATYFVENGVVVFPPDLTRVFSLFSLFNSAYQFQLRTASFIKLLDTMNLNYINKNNYPDTPKKDYTPIFKNALKEAKSLIKLTGKEDIHPLNEIFTPLFNLSRGNAQTMTITEVHFRAIIAMYNLETVSLADQAQTLFCLAAIFVKYSSSYIFGTEDESPYVIRTYGAALLNKARELNPILFTNALFKDWMDRLVGITGAQTFASCTAQLSSDLMAFANRQQDFRNTLAKMKPPAW